MDFDTTSDIMFTFIPILMIGMVLFVVVKGISQWNSNNQSPKLTVAAFVAGKRTNTSSHHHGGEHAHSSASTTYYVTFQFESGDRSEFSVSGSAYGMLAEGDTGRLTFQGTRYFGFDRVQE